MNKSQIAAIAAIIVVALAGLIYIIAAPNETAKFEGKIGATIFPLYDIAKNVAGDKIEVVLVAPAGASPHTFEPSPADIKNLSGSRVIFSIGEGLDNWTQAIAAALLGTAVKPVSEGIVLIMTEEDEEEEEENGHHEEAEEGHEHHHGDTNPHYWLSVPNAKIIAENITAEIILLDPENEAYYRENLSEYNTRLDDADSAVRLMLRNIPNKNIITMHDAWPYFAQEYGLEVVGTFEPFPGREPSAKYLADLAQTAERYDVKTIFSEPQLANQILFPFLQDYGLKLEILDPLGGIENRSSYIETMLYNARAINESF